MQTLLDHAAGRHVGYAGSAMQRYYDGWQPASAIESLGLQGEAMSDAMVGLGPLEAVSPWWPDTGGGLPAAAAAHLCRRTRTENRENGADMGCEDGIILFGPVSPRKGQLEYDRLVRVWHSIASGGYRRSNAWQGDVTGTLLVRADGPAGTSDAVVMIGAGQHRVAALAAALTPELAPAPAASGLTEGRTGPDAVIPVRFTRTLSPRVIRREDAASWPYVRNGWFTADQARRVFDRIHDGPPLGPSGA